MTAWAMLLVLAAAQDRVGFSAGLQLTWASAIAGEPDYEHVVTILKVDSAEARVRISWNRGVERRWRNTERPVSAAERRRARAIYFYGSEEDPREFRGATQSMASTAVLRDLTSGGQAAVVLLVPEMTPTPFRGTIQRVGAGPEAFPLLVDGRSVTVPGVRARGMVQGAWAAEFELLLLDDPEAAWVLEARLGSRRAGVRDGRRILVRVGTAARRSTVTSALETRCAVSIHDIYFASGSDLIDSTSSPALAAIAGTLADHPDWRLTIVGHTDSIGGEATNLDLSRRRAARVRSALVSGYRVGAARLAAEGRGETQPIDDNGTVPGRARNRRVDLVRPCAR